jgi:hypothetical protein
MLPNRFDIKGPGLTKAAQEAVSAKKSLYIYHESDDLGRIIRIGYFLSIESMDRVNIDDVIWFDMDEIEILPKIATPPVIGQARMDIEYTNPRREEENNILLEIPIDVNTVLVFRNVFRIKDGSYKDFMIQVEIKKDLAGNKINKPIVRYDCAHGVIHRDLLLSRNRKIKTELASQQPKDAISLALQDIVENISDWLAKKDWQKLSEILTNNPEFEKELERVKIKLQELFDNPELVMKTQSNLRQYAYKIDLH